MAALILGLLGLVLPFLPIDMTGVRHYVALPFGLAGLALGIVGLVGRRRGKPLAAVGVMLCLFVSALGVFMIGIQAVN